MSMPPEFDPQKQGKYPPQQGFNPQQQDPDPNQQQGYDPQQPGPDPQQPGYAQQPGNGPQQPGYGQQGPPHGYESTTDERMMAVFCHLSVFVIGFVGPLVIWLIKKDTSPLVDDQGKEALNFAISMTIYTIISVFSIFIFFIGIPMLIALAIFGIVMPIIAAVKSNSGEFYRYPLCIRIIS